MLLDFNKPKKIMTEQERQDKYSSDCSIPGTFVPNMSINDMRKWKGQYIKGKDERVEIRKTINGTQLVIIVYKEVRYETKEHYGSNETYEYLVHKNIHISANGKILLTFEEFNELLKVINEAQEVLNGYDVTNEICPIKSERGLSLIKDVSNLNSTLKMSISGLEIDDNVYVNKIPNRKGHTYAVQNNYGHTFSNIDGEFYVESSPSNRDDLYYKEFRFNTIEEAIISYFKIKENNNTL